MKNEDRTPKGVRPSEILLIVIVPLLLAIILVSLHSRHTAKIAKSDPVVAKRQLTVPALRPVRQQDAERLQSQTNDSLVIIDQGGTVVFSPASKVKPPMLTEKEVLAMQSAARAAANNNQ
jgi:anaerobic C4-dicarboxylate transporter